LSMSEWPGASRVGFNVPHIIGHIGDDFYGSDDPTNSVEH